MNDEKKLADELLRMLQTAMGDPRIADADLIPVLRFIGRVASVVEQAFDELFAVLIKLRHLKPDDLQEPRRTEILKDLENILERSRYRDAEEICSRLHHLSDQYAKSIQPRLGELISESEWPHVFGLLDEHEGRIITLVRARVHHLHNAVTKATSAELPSIRQDAASAADELGTALRELWSLRNGILGLSGNAGYLELLETGGRNEATEAASRQRP